MNFRSLFILLILSGVFYACGNNSEGNAGSDEGVTDQQQNQSTQQQPNINVDMDPNAGTVVYHYICPNNCEGSGANQQGTCPVCGTAYVHNSAYHNTQQFQNQQQQQQQQVQQEAPPAQNAAGVYHYICAAGCEGGAAGPGVCPTCGGEMVHNDAYHQ